jgi:CHAT domain-containing protein
LKAITNDQTILIAEPSQPVVGVSLERRQISHQIGWPHTLEFTGHFLAARPRTPRLTSTPERNGAIPLALEPLVAARASSGSVASVFRGSEPDPKKLRQLDPLPATAGELRALAKALGASETADVYLRERATEAQIKSLDLSHKHVIAFATHGLMAGDMGLGEPGLVFTPPASPSERDDGYLAASEVAGLNLKADWIILSACNTAAGDTPGAKGLSGLARAFFLAGSKSLLVSHWPVWDTAAMKLTTGAVANMQKNPAAGRAEALRQSMLTLMNDRRAPYFAHPAAWAPFVLVGETR